MSFFIVNVSVMNVYSQPLFESAVVTQALMGESCVIIDQKDGWYYLEQWDGYHGWAFHFFGIVQDKPYVVTHTFVERNGFVLNEANNNAVRSLTYGNLLHAEQISDGYNIILPDGLSGYIANGLREKPLLSERHSIVETAKSFSGIPYLWGGKSSYGFDCSGYVQTVFKAHGIDLPRDAFLQAEFFEEEIDRLEAQQGDIFFFAEKEKISHVAISLGGEHFINARGWVKTESLNSNASNYNKTLNELYVKAASINKLIST